MQLQFWGSCRIKYMRARINFPSTVEWQLVAAQASSDNPYILDVSIADPELIGGPAGI